jgi:hypothetical protein
MDNRSYHQEIDKELIENNRVSLEIKNGTFNLSLIKGSFFTLKHVEYPFYYFCANKAIDKKPCRSKRYGEIAASALQLFVFINLFIWKLAKDYMI